MFASRYNYAFMREIVNSVPTMWGIYRLYQGSECIYIGRAAGLNVTLRSRLHDHLAGRDGPCTQAADSFDYEICLNPVERERTELVEFRRRHFRLPRCNDRIG